MYITNKQLSELLVDGDYLDLESSDIIDWDDKDKTSMVCDYLALCSADDKREIAAECMFELDLLKFYTNPAEFLNAFDQTVYLYLENILREEIVEEIEALKDAEDESDREFHNNVLGLINYQFARMH
jgi:hypothetical protein